MADSDLITRLAQRLSAKLGADAVLTGESVHSRLAGVSRTDTLKAAMLVRPRSTAEVSLVMKACSELGQRVVVHGGLTGLVHGAEAAPDAVILSTERMTAIESVDVDGRTLTAQAGATIESIQQAAVASGLYYAVDYGSRSSATLGGGIATNAGGNRVVRFGMTRASVLGLEAVLADGTVISSMNTMIKNNSGYDLKQLFIGSEGTLGIVTRAVMRLYELPRSQNTALVAVPAVADLARLLKRVDAGLGGQLAAFEVMWSEYFQIASEGIEGVAGRRLFAKDYPCYALIEAVGSDTHGDADRLLELLESVLDDGIASEVLLAQSLDQRNAFWKVRDNVEALLRHRPVRYFDVSLPIGEMPAYAQAVRQGILQRWPHGHCWVFGHMADGNLHVSVAIGEVDDKTLQEAEAIIYEPLRRFRGAISAEHGVGLEKKAWLDVSRTPEEIALMATIKRALDPRGLLNAGLIFDA